jgi:hypothetical protein
MVLWAGPLLAFSAYVDASFALHGDSKSHTGVAIFMGGALVFAASCKQKCVMKSPTENELVALSDNLGFVELFEEFLTFEENRGKQVPTIYQDSTSAISLVTKGGGVVRTKHPRVRMNLVKEAVNERRVRVEHIRTKKMVTDGFMKTLE